MFWLQRGSRCFNLSTALSLPLKFARNFQCRSQLSLSVRQFARLIQHPSQKNKFLQNAENQQAQRTMTDQVQYLEAPDKSEEDKKIYKTIRLSNGLHALLISDPCPMPHDGFTSSDSSVNTDETSGETDTSSDTTSSSNCSFQSSSESDSEVGDEKLAACAVMMDYGSFAEPRNYQGLAHFLEHMIFMGSEKYPEENIFDSHIKKCGGYSNALTETEDTLFFFEVAEKHLDSSLDYFTALMKNPLMKQEAMQRERCSVEAEFQQIVQDDETRRDQILASLATDGYPHGTFAWGNIKTLKDDVDDNALYTLLHETRRNHYAANRMYMCIQARLPMEDLESLVVSHFASIPSNEVSSPDMSKFHFRNAFRDEFYEHAFFVKPVENVIKLELTWVLPSVRPYYRSKPDQLLAHLLGYEGVGSLCSYLRRRLWALEVFAGTDDNGFDLNSMYSLFNVCIFLTDSGFKHLDDVLAATFGYVKLIAQAPPMALRQIYEELQNIEKTAFRYQPQSPAMDNVRHIVFNTKYFPPKDVLTGKTLLYEYNEEHLAEFIGYLNEFRFNIMVTAQKFEDLDFDKVEPWFGTEYTSIPMPAKWQRLWNEVDVKAMTELILPDANRFVTEDFGIFWQLNGKPVQPDYPKKIMQTETCELWFRVDDKFDLPEAFMYFYFISPLLRMSPKNDAMTTLYSELVKFHVSEELYPAVSAGLYYSFNVCEKGLMLLVHGYNEKLHLLVDYIAKAMVNVGATLNDDLLATFVNAQRKSYFNTLIKPRSLNRDIRLCTVQHMRAPMIEKYKCLSKVTLKDLQEFARQFPEQLFVQGLIQGNYSEESAHNVMNALLTSLGCKPIQERCYVEDRTVQLPDGGRYIRCHALNENDTNTVITNYYQIGPSTVRLECILDLIMMLVEEPLFDQLRTKEQLGYHVGATVRINYGIIGYSITVNSQETNTTASFVEERIELFRIYMLQLLQNLSEENYEHSRDSLIKLKQVADMALSTEVGRNWNEITNDDYIFDRRRQHVEMLRTLTKREIIGFLEDNEEINFRKMSVQVIGHKQQKKSPPSANDMDVDDVGKDCPAKIEDVDVENSDETEDLFNSLANKLQIVFLPHDGDPKNVDDISGFKSTLRLYPLRSNAEQDATRPPLIEDVLMNT